ncbi:uncharacterized protein LODBEIA_P14370 [Lodderomyces beijingensis]|uniref:Uncharacterized protein n=1 Tax=Lodderomyces beijingensis TaxID=1775926 RepID=A0ABP0ZGD2_9ASCO
MVIALAVAAVGVGAVALHKERKKRKLRKLSQKEQQQFQAYENAQRSQVSGRNYVQPPPQQQGPPRVQQQPGSSMRSDRSGSSRSSNAHAHAAPSQPPRASRPHPQSQRNHGNVPSTPMKPSTFRPATQRVSHDRNTQRSSRPETHRPTVDEYDPPPAYTP